MSKSNPDIDADVIEILDLLIDLEILKSEADWRMLSETQVFDENLKKLKMAVPDEKGSHASP
jgi:hypothetical protein